MALLSERPRKFGYQMQDPHQTQHGTWVVTERHRRFEVIRFLAEFGGHDARREATTYAALERVPSGWRTR